MPESLKERHERAVGNRFIEWFNDATGAGFAFQGRAGEAPDLHYRDGEEDLFLEVVDAYYDEGEARWRWLHARGAPDAPDRWSGVNVDDKLVEHVNVVLADKCAKAYGPNCLLVVNVRPPLTTAEEFEAMRPNLRIPKRQPFKAIYVTGDFPGSSDGSRGGYRCWKVA